MNKDLKRLYTCSLDNKVVIFETNFSDFYKSLKNFEPKVHSKSWFEKNHFRDGEMEFEYIVGDKVYYIQRLL